MIRPKHCRKHRKARLYVQAPLVVLLVLVFALTWDSSGILRMGLLCALLHEGGHIGIYRFLFGAWPDLRISPFGICLLLRGAPLRPAESFLLAAAGPLVNLLGCCGVLFWMHATGQYRYAAYWFACTNLLVGGMNLLPLPGLDGARILQSFWR